MNESVHCGWATGRKAGTDRGKTIDEVNLLQQQRQQQKRDQKNEEDVWGGAVAAQQKWLTQGKEKEKVGSVKLSNHRANWVLY